MAKTATGKRCFSSVFFFIPHFVLETVTKSATKAANNKTRVKAGEFHVYMRVLHSFANIFFPLLSSNNYCWLRISSLLDKPAAADKPKREPSAYQIFCKENMKKWNEENPGRAKEAMTQVLFFSVVSPVAFIYSHSCLTDRASVERCTREP